MRIYVLTLLGVFVIIPSLLFLFSVNLYGQQEDLVHEAAIFKGPPIEEPEFYFNFGSVNSDNQYNNKIFEVPINSSECSEVQPNQNLENNWFKVKHVKDRDGGGRDDPPGIPKFAIYRILYKNPKNDKIKKTRDPHFLDVVNVDWWEKTPTQKNNNSDCDSNNKGSEKGVTELSMDLYNYYEENVELDDCKLEVNELEDSKELDIYFSCFAGANKDGAYIKRIEIEAPEGITYKPREGSNDKIIRITNAPEVTEDTKDKDVYIINFSAYFCTGNINDVPKRDDVPVKAGEVRPADHDQCTEAPQGKNGTIEVTVKNVVDGECGTFQTRCIAGTERNAAVNSATWACFCRQKGTFAAWYCEGKNGGNDSGTCEDCSAGSVFDGACADGGRGGGCLCATTPPRGTSNSYQCSGYGGGTATCFWGDTQETGAVKKDRAVVITFDTDLGQPGLQVETDPAGVNIKNRGSRVQSITFRPTDNYSRGETSWRIQKIYKNQACNSEIFKRWNDLPVYQEGSPITLGSAADNDYTFCFASRKSDDNIDYEPAEYYVTIDTTYNRSIRFSVGGAPTAPSITISGTAEPGAAVTAVSAESNGIPIALGGEIRTTADQATGAWSIIIHNAVDPDQETNLEVVVRTTDDFSNEIEQTHRTTINEDGTVDSTTTTTTGGGGGEGGSGAGTGTQQNTLRTPPDPPVSPPAEQSPFTIKADNARISEGESIEWTIKPRDNATKPGFTVTCGERGAWGATPLEFTKSSAEGSFTMKTVDDDKPESSGSITCSVQGDSSTGKSSYSVSITSNDQVKESNLIVNCSFGEGNDCGIEHLFELANNIMKLLLWLAITGAGILIFYRGAVLAINVFVKGGDQDARKKVQDALKAILWGLVFILSAYLIVKAGFNIIGYNLGNPFQWDESTLPDVKMPEESTRRTPSQRPADNNGGGNTEPQTSRDFPKLNGSGIPHKTLALDGCKGSECFVAKSLFDKLNALRTATSASWWVTESCPPTMPHAHSCHTTERCDCVDINFKEGGDSNHNPSLQEVEDFIAAINSINSYAVYEIPTGDINGDGKDYADLRGKIPEKNYAGGKVSYFRVSYPHFSVYESKAAYDKK